MSDSGTNPADEASDAKQLWTALKVVFGLAGLGLLWLMQYSSMGGPTVREMIRIEMLIGDGHYDQAIEATSRRIEEIPTSVWAHTMRGEAYRRKGDLDHAFADLDEAIRLDPKADDAFYDRCLAFHDKGDIDRAVADCEQAALIKPGWNSYQAIAAMLFARGDFDRAYERLGMFDNLEPKIDLPAPHFYRGQIALFVYDRPADAAAEFATAANQALSAYSIGYGLDFSDLPKASGPDNHSIPLAFKFIPDGLYLLVWNHIARVRAGQDDTKELADRMEELRQPVWRELFNEKPMDNVTAESQRKSLAPWPGVIFALILGKTTPEAVRAAAEREADPGLRQKKLCDADFYLAEYQLEKGAPDEARKLLQAAADGCPASARESWFAKSELKRIKS
jgi:tetratricopeptide (TPR) repeat protein